MNENIILENIVGFLNQIIVTCVAHGIDIRHHTNTYV